MEHKDQFSSSEVPHTSSDGSNIHRSASSLYITLEQQETEAQNILDALEEEKLTSLVVEYSSLGFLPTEILEEVRVQQEIDALENLELKDLAEKFLNNFFPPTTSLKMARKTLQDQE